MAEKKKGIGGALIDLFVVRGEEPIDVAPAAAPPPQAAAATGDRAIDDLIARYGSTAPARGPSASAPAAASSRPSGSVEPQVEPQVEPLEVEVAVPESVPQIDAQAVLRKAGLSAEEQGRVDKALTLLHTLPAGTPIDLKRQIVAASLQAFGIPVDQILEAALLYISAFEGHARAGETETQTQLEQSNRRLAELEQEAARIKLQMQELRSQQQGLAFACSRQKLLVKEVLDFFGPEAVEHARQSSVKLRDRQDS